MKLVDKKNVLIFCSAPSWQTLQVAERLVTGSEDCSYQFFLPVGGELELKLRSLGHKTLIGEWEGMFVGSSLSTSKEQEIAMRDFTEIYILCATTDGYEDIIRFCRKLNAERIGLIFPDLSYKSLKANGADVYRPSWLGESIPSANMLSADQLFYTDKAYSSRLSEEPLWESFGGVFETTFLCNFECMHCPRKVADLDRGKSIDPKAFSRFISDERISHVTLLGLGETFMNPGFGEISKIIAGKSAPTAIVTNGSYLHPEKLDHLLDGDLTLVVSMDGAEEETFDSLRREGHLSRVQENLRRVIRIHPQVSVEINTVVSTGNYRQTPGIVRMAAELGAKKVNLLNLLALESESDHSHCLRVPAEDRENAFLEARRLAEELGIEFSGKPLRPSLRTCLSPWSQMYVSMSGDVYPCSFIYRIPADEFDEYFLDTKLKVPLKAFRLGNLTRDSLDDIWNGGTARRIRRILLESQEDRQLDVEEFLVLRRETSLDDPLEYCKICLNRWSCAC